MRDKRIIYYIGGFFFIFLFIIGIIDYKDALRAQKYGQLITVTVTEVSGCIGGRRAKHYFKFEYLDNGIIKESGKQIGGSFCKELFIGKKVILKADLNNRYFLLENENIKIDLYSSIALGITGLIFLLIGIKKSN